MFFSCCFIFLMARKTDWCFQTGLWGHYAQGLPRYGGGLPGQGQLCYLNPLSFMLIDANAWRFKDKHVISLAGWLTSLVRSRTLTCTHIHSHASFITVATDSVLKNYSPAHAHAGKSLSLIPALWRGFRLLILLFFASPLNMLTVDVFATKR